MWVKKQQFEPDMGQWTGSKLVVQQRVQQGCILSPHFLSSVQNKSCEMPSWMNHKPESRLPEKYQQPQVCTWYHFYVESEEEVKSLLMRVKRKTEKFSLKLNIQKTKTVVYRPTTSWQIHGEKVEAVTHFIFFGSKITADSDGSLENKRCLLLGKKGKNWCFWIVVLDKTLESPLDCKEIQPVHPKWNQSWIFIGRTDVEAETPILWPPIVNNRLIWRDSDAEKVWRQEEKGTTEDEMVGWHHWLNGREFE